MKERRSSCSSLLGCCDTSLSVGSPQHLQISVSSLPPQLWTTLILNGLDTLATINATIHTHTTYYAPTKTQEGEREREILSIFTVCTAHIIFILTNARNVAVIDTTVAKLFIKKIFSGKKIKKNDISILIYQVL